MAVATIPNAGMAKMLERMQDDCRLVLFTDPTTVDKDTVFGDLSEATFSGYAAIDPIPWGTITTDPTDGASDEAPDLTFTRTSTGSPETVRGWGIVTNDDDTLLACAILAVAKVFENAGDALIVNLSEIHDDLP